MWTCLRRWWAGAAAEPRTVWVVQVQAFGIVPTLYVAIHETLPGQLPPGLASYLGLLTHEHRFGGPLWQFQFPAEAEARVQELATLFGIKVPPDMVVFPLSRTGRCVKGCGVGTGMIG